VVESSRRSRAFIRLNIQEYRWLAVEMVRFCSSKGEPLWVRTFKGTNRCLLLLRKNVRGRFIVFSLVGSFGRSGTIIFPDGSNADGWLALTKILEESLIYGNLEASSKQFSRPVARKFRVGRNLSFADVVRGRLIDPQSSYLRG